MYADFVDYKINSPGTPLRLEAELAWHEEVLKALPGIFAGADGAPGADGAGQA